LESEFSKFTEMKKGWIYLFWESGIRYPEGIKKNETPVMHPNPGYLDCKLAPSAIPFITFYYPERSLSETDDYFKYYEYPIIGDVIMNSIIMGSLAGLIMRKK
jgi:hypothetical protein